MDILSKITEHKRAEMERQKDAFPETMLRRSHHFKRETVSLADALTSHRSQGIIAEFKRRSPSAGVINDRSDPGETARGYESAGASALSVLTDQHFFGGSSTDLEEARTATQLPILRKDFIIDEYQVTESKAIGADAILLIASVLSPEETLILARSAVEIGLEVLLEVREENQLDRINDYTKIVGVNNRDLRTFKTSLARSVELSQHIPAGKVRVAESGLGDPADIIRLRELGYKGFLIGESFMRTGNPTEACRQMITSLMKTEQSANG